MLSWVGANDAAKEKTTMKLSPAQLRALESFAMTDGHGFGEYSGISRSTAFALARAGLVIIGSTTTVAGNVISKALVTQKGVDALRAVGSVFCPRSFDPAYRPFGWVPWATVPAARRGGARVPAAH